MKIRLHRMCGGGVPELRRRWWWRYPDHRIDWAVLRPRRVPGALVLDWLGIALAWGWDR